MLCEQMQNPATLLQEWRDTLSYGTRESSGKSFMQATSRMMMYY